MRSHRRHQPLAHVLIAGTLRDLADVRATLALLTPDTYGQVFIERPAGTGPPSLSAPARITVHHIAGRTADDAPAAIQAGGSALAVAIDSWTAEWIPEDETEDREVTIWVGADASTHLDAQCHHLGDLIERL